MGIVYALSEGEIPKKVPRDEAFFLKIGYTGKESATSRVTSCQTGNPRVLSLLREFPNSSSGHEHHLHQILSKYRQAGEWFLLPGELVRRFRYKRVDSASALIRELESAGLGLGGRWYHEHWRGSERDLRLKRARAHGEEMIDCRIASIRAKAERLRDVRQEVINDIDRSIAETRKRFHGSIGQQIIDRHLDARLDVIEGK